MLRPLMRVCLATTVTGSALLLASGPASALSPGQQPEAASSWSTQILIAFLVGIPLLIIGVIWALVMLPGTRGSSAASLEGPWQSAPLWFNGPDNAGALPAAEAGSGGSSARW